MYAVSRAGDARAEPLFSEAVSNCVRSRVGLLGLLSATRILAGTADLGCGATHEPPGDDAKPDAFERPEPMANPSTGVALPDCAGVDDDGGGGGSGRRGESGGDPAGLGLAR